MKVIDLAGTGSAWTFRRLPDALIDLGVSPRHVLHVGANLGQEVPHYRAAGIEAITLVEPDPATAAQLRELHPDLPVIEAACGTQAGTATLRRAAGADVWSTLASTPLPFRRQVTDEVDVRVVPVRDIQADADMLVIDTQGTELDVLMSADLLTLRLVVIETQSVKRTLHAGYLPDIAAHMQAQGWAPVLQWRHEEDRKYFATFADTFFQPVPPGSAHV